MDEYRFAESEEKHVSRVRNTYRRTVQLRRALLGRYNHRNYALPDHIERMSPVELMDQLGVDLDKEAMVFTPRDGWAPKTSDIARAAVRKAHYTKVDGAGSKRDVRLERGLPITRLPYGYIQYEGPDGTAMIAPNPDWTDTIQCALRTAIKYGYSAAANWMNEARYPTASGQKWNKDSARAFVRNPFHAGYAWSFEGTHNKRGSAIIHLLPPATMPQTLLTLAEWIAANKNYVETTPLQFPGGFRTPEDEQAWLKCRKA